MVLTACDGSPTAGGEPDHGRAATTAAGGGGTRSPTPACDDGDDPTPSQTEGPYFTPDSPERASLLEAGMGGQRLVVAGTVLTSDCRRSSETLLDFYVTRLTPARPRQPGLPPARPPVQRRRRRLARAVMPASPAAAGHVKVQAPDSPILTTQLYFPGEPDNDRDGIFRPELLLGDVRDRGDTRQASFTFVLER